MKWIASILALIVLTLSFVPCADGHTQHADAPAMLTEQPAAPDHTDLHTDHCSPLCSCSCCAAVVLPAIFFYQAAVPPHQAPVYDCDLEPRLHSLSFAVWQPPQ